MTHFFALRRARYLCTVATAQPITISHLKNRLKNIYDPDKALKVYSYFIATNDPSKYLTSVRSAQEVVVRRLAKAHRFSDVKNFLELQKSQPLIKNEYFLSSLIRSYGVAGLLEDAVNTFNQMPELGTPQSSLSFSCLLSACVQCKAYDRVTAYFDELPPKLGFEPDQFAYAILIKAYCDMGSLDKAMQKLKEMEEKGIGFSPVGFTTILHTLYEKNQVDEAEKFWDEMVVKKGYKPDEGSYNVRLSHLSNGKPEAVKALIEEMENAGLKPDTISYNYLLTCYCLNRKMDEAKKLYDEMLLTKGRHPNAATFRTMVFHLCKKGRYVTGYRVFKQSVEAGKIPNFSTLKYLVEGLVKKGHMVEAKGMIRTMNKKFPPEVSVAWRKLVGDLGLGHVGAEEVESGEVGAEAVETRNINL